MTKEDVLKFIISLYPDFKKEWQSSDNCFVNEDGSHTYCGVFSTFSNYFRDHKAEFSEAQLRGLFEKIESWQRSEEHITNDQWLKGDVPEEIQLSNASCTCFLENIAGEGLTDRIKQYLGPKSLKYYCYWDHS